MTKRGILLGRMISLDVQRWVCELRKNNILQFEYRNLPTNLKNKAILIKSRQEGLIISIGKNGNGTHIWRIADNIKCKDEDSKYDDNEK